MSAAIELVKSIGGLVVSFGSGAITGNLIKATTPEDTKKIIKICIGLSGCFISTLVGDAASDKFEGAIDKVVETMKDWANKSEQEDIETEPEDGIEIEA